MTTADLHTVSSCPLVTDRAAPSARDTPSTRPSDVTGRGPLRGAAEALRRAARWAAEELHAGAEMSARRDAVRTADERRFLGRP